MSTAYTLASVDASLNALSALFLACGYILIKRGNQKAHRNCMVAALVSSTVFLGFYLFFHTVVKIGATRFQGPPLARTIYLTILISHTILAVVIVPMVIMNVRHAVKQRWEAHKRLARWLWPMWMYVSVTGVVVYFMLYHLFPSA
jgi:putative membrane protein